MLEPSALIPGRFRCPACGLHVPTRQLFCVGCGCSGSDDVTVEVVRGIGVTRGRTVGQRDYQQPATNNDRNECEAVG